ncbi:MAG: 2-polyprenylphenol 6-hydroxylase [Kiloniellales bacterium]
MLRSFRTLFRLLAIARTLARHDALAPLQELGVAPSVAWVAARLSRRRVPGRPGQKLAAALTELGPSFIKLGQFLSTRADLLGEQMAADLSALQDRLPPFPSDEARATIEAELGQPVEALFACFEDQPVSAASIAQVHFAEVVPEEPQEEETGEDEPTGKREKRQVAVKVLRPGIERAFARDLALFYSLAALAERTQPGLRRFKPVQVVHLFEDTVRIEMNLRMEAAAASELAENFAGDPSYVVPAVDWQRSAQRVLTMERRQGIPLDDRETLLAAGHNLEDVLTKAAVIFFRQVFRDGFFHGDQHPGNLSVDAEGNIVAVDFGIMGRLDRKTRRYLADMLLATLARDYRRLAEVHVEAGYLPRGGDLEVFAQALRSVCEPIFGQPLNRISFARLLAQLLQLTESFAMPVQPQLLLLQKNMLMAEGVSRTLCPDLNIWLLAQPLIEDWMKAHRGPQARLQETLAEAAAGLERLPETLANMARLSDELTAGGLRLHPETLQVLAHKDRSHRLQSRLLWLALVLLAGLWLFA